ncbi:hypothetical protein [Lyngbya sp. PCC 8106]|uniref:hypothetical protein n=1 Tax=Lyngbya sp. (strain PCC 8106) TaxID=313612 RepID=UPI0002D82E01|nr:hypothetical protein [Lyngbya sp. PCC 8106]
MPKQPYLLADNLTHEFRPDRRLFKNVQLSLAKCDRVAPVCANGVGKSTLPQILAGQISNQELIYTYQNVREFMSNSTRT